MARNASGNYTLPAGNPVVTGTVIASTWANTTLDDLKTEMTDSLSRSGKGGMLAPLALVNGAVGAPALAFSSELSTGLYRPAASELALVVAGTELLRLATTGTEPAAKLTSTLAAGSGQTDFQLVTSNTRTAGALLELLNNGVSVLKLDPSTPTGAILMGGTLPRLIAGPTNTGLAFYGRKDAADAGADHTFNTVNTRTAGAVLDVQNNGGSLLSLKFNGDIYFGSTNVGLVAGPTNSGLVHFGRKDAADAGTDHTLDTVTTRTAGNLLNVRNAGTTKLSVSFDGEPQGAYVWRRVVATADTSNSTTAAATDIAGLSFAAASGKKYLVRAKLFTYAAAITTGLGISLKSTGAPTTSTVFYTHQHYTTSLSTFALQSFAAFLDTPSAFADTFSTTAGSPQPDDLNGYLVTTGSGTIQLRLITEVNTSAVTVKAGSYLEYMEI